MPAHGECACTATLCRENGIDPDAPPKGHPGMVFGTAFAAALVAAAAFAIARKLGPKPAAPPPRAWTVRR